MSAATLHFFCGKAGAGKTTLAKALAAANNGIFLSEDVWLSRLYGDQIRTFDDFIRCSRKLSTAISPLVVDLLRAGQSVVMDFQANTKQRRGWFRPMFEEAGAEHVMHFLPTSDVVCLARIAQRNLDMPEGAGRLTEADYWHVTSYFEPPESSEGFCIQVHAT